MRRWRSFWYWSLVTVYILARLCLITWAIGAVSGSRWTSSDDVTIGTWLGRLESILLWLCKKDQIYLYNLQRLHINYKNEIFQIAIWINTSFQHWWDLLQRCSHYRWGNNRIALQRDARGSYHNSSSHRIHFLIYFCLVGVWFLSELLNLVHSYPVVWFGHHFPQLIEWS